MSTVIVRMEHDDTFKMISRIPKLNTDSELIKFELGSSNNPPHGNAILSFAKSLPVDICNNNKVFFVEFNPISVFTFNYKRALTERLIYLSLPLLPEFDSLYRDVYLCAQGNILLVGVLYHIDMGVVVNKFFEHFPSFMGRVKFVPILNEQDLENVRSFLHCYWVCFGDAEDQLLALYSMFYNIIVCCDDNRKMLYVNDDYPRMDFMIEALTGTNRSHDLCNMVQYRQHLLAKSNVWDYNIVRVLLSKIGV